MSIESTVLLRQPRLSQPRFRLDCEYRYARAQHVRAEGDPPVCTPSWGRMNPMTTVSPRPHRTSVRYKGLKAICV